MMCRRYRPPCPRDAGQALVEFAIVFPILLIVVFAIIQLALAYSAHAVLHYAAFSAARSYVVYQDKERAESAARMICLTISSRPTAMVESALDSLGIDMPSFDAGPLSGIAGVAERYVYSAYATRLRVLDSSGALVADGRILSPGTEDVTVEVSHKFRLALPIVNRLMGTPMAGESIARFFDAGLFYLPLTARITMTVEDAPPARAGGPCFGNSSLGCCLTRDEVKFIGCRGNDSCAAEECCPERSKKTWRVTPEAEKKRGLTGTGTIVREMTCAPSP